jgi:hypothetical protein
MLGNNPLLFSCAMAYIESIRVDGDIHVRTFAIPAIPFGVSESCGLKLKFN